MKFTLLVYVLLYGSGQQIQMDGFTSKAACEKGAAYVRELIVPKASGVDASQYLRHVCVPVR